MKNITRYVSTILAFILVFMLTGCGEAKVTPSVTFGFKTTDGDGKYSESISAFEVNKRFYTCITVKIVTDKQTATDYMVKVTVPKTDEIEMLREGGKNPDSKYWDKAKQQTVLYFTISGSKEAVDEKIMFRGKPLAEGDADITVEIFDSDGVEITNGYSRNVMFLYELQE